MSTSSIEAIMKQVNATIQEDNMPEWLDQFLGKKFFDKCPAHCLQANDLNRYCITCNESTCKLCITAGFHKEHRLLTIYRHVYQDVVPLSEMENHINCDKIQPYKCNKKWVLSLVPLPHNGSGSLIDGDGACHICKRKLTDPDRYRFCSIACKFSQVQSIPVQNEIQQPIMKVRALLEGEETSEHPKARKRSRKGVPHRAPFF